MQYDVFVSHASEDKEAFVAPLAKTLSELGLKVWYDEFSLKIGDSLSRSIDKGLYESAFGIIVLSKAFMSKPWPDYELRGLVSKEISSGKVILPLWHGVSRDDVLQFSPTLADTMALDTSKLSPHQIAFKILEVVRPEIHQDYSRLIAFEKLIKSAKVEEVPISNLKPGPIRHKTLPESLLVRIKIVHHIFSDVWDNSLEDFINQFRRDLRPQNQVAYWEKMAAVYLEVTRNPHMGLEQRKEVLGILLGVSTQSLTDEKAGNFKYLSSDEVIAIVDLCGTVVPKIVDPENESEI